ncbi:MAG: molecular chaperone HtpG [Ruminococcaceae bacterium]|nr:molecular chaperone HtpG [Oscillospiraceae bacterium]
MSNKENINKGGISVETEHIFPIIKKWLYSEKEIFLREIVSNASDAVTKLKRLISLGKVKDIEDEFKITVTLNKDEKTLTVSDNGIGMTLDEVKNYICQIALSGALDFIKEYEGEDGSKNGIIGHFGLGFYSSFMVSDTVDVITKSYTGSPAVKWVCNEAGEYEIFENVEKDCRGTDVVMHISDAEAEFLSENKIREILNKYCSFMPVEIYFVNEGDEHKCNHEHNGEECDCEHENEPINDTTPLWQKLPSECEESEYNEFYKKVFSDFREPLFHIHINADYPLNFKGILYFPRINHEYDSLEGQVKLYYNQVFVADNIKEVIPEFMLMLKGVLDCPELPLNVSRSYLQNSAYVSKMSAHIVKKVADKLNGMFTNEREKYESLWDDIKMFIEYGCMRDRKFYDRAKGSLLFALTDGRHVTVDEYLEKAKEKNENTVYYATDKTVQAQYISLFNAQGIEIALLDKVIDTSFMGMLEQDRNIKFVRVDADIEALKGDGEVFENEDLAKLFKEVSKNEKLNVKFEALAEAKTPALLNISEDSRRMEDMMKFYAAHGGMEEMNIPTESTLVLNTESALIKKLCNDTQSEKAKIIAHQVYMLALLAQRQLSADELQEFLCDSFKLLENNID